MDRARTITAVGAATLLGLGGLLLLGPRPAVDNRPSTWFPTDDPRLAGWRRLAEEFGSDDTVVAAVDGGDPLEALRLAATVARELAEEGAIERVLSAPTSFPAEVDLLLDPALGGLANLRFVGRTLDGPLNRTLRLWRPDGPGAASVYATMRHGVTTAEVEALHRRLVDLQARVRAEGGGRRLLVAGQPLVNLELDRAGRDVDARAMPLVVGMCVLTLGLATRALRSTAALVAVVGLGVLSTDPLLAVAGTPTNLIVAVVKPLAFVTLLAAGLHVTVAYAERRALGQSGREAALGAAAEKAWGTTLCLVTSAIGFGSLLGSDVAPIRCFGALTAVAVFLGVPLLLGGLPLLLLATGRGGPTAVPGEEAAGAWLGRAAVALVHHGDRRAAPWLVVAGLLAAAGATIAARLTPQTDAVAYFPAAHPLRVDHDALVAGGAHLVSVEALVDLPAAVGSDAAAVERLDAFARAGRAVPGVHGCLGLPLLLREAVHRTARADGLPAPWLVADIVRRAGPEARPFLSADGRLARLSFQTDEVDPDRLDAIEAGLRAAYAGAFPEGSGARLELSGSYGLLLGAQRALLSTLGGSLLSTVVMMLIVMAAALRSPLLALAALPANALPVAAVFITMRLADIPLDVGTSMTAAIALGISIDETLHLLHAWQHGDLVAAARAAGTAVVLGTTVIGMGFLSLATSDFAPTRNFGLLCAASMPAALLGDLVVLPATLRLVGPLVGRAR